MNELLKGQMLLIMGEVWDTAVDTGKKDFLFEPEDLDTARAALIWEAAHKVLTLVNRAQEER